jgi:polyketide cyclase/dehydrase/lipid transport protein
MIAANALIDASPAAVFGFLADLENHCVLAGPRLRIVSLHGPRGARDGGVMRIRGPLWLRRTATTRVVATTAAREIVGRAQIGRNTTARVRWLLQRHEGATAVCLSATVERAAIIDRLLLELGARRWLRRAFTRALGRLGDQFAGASALGGAGGADRRPSTAALANHVEP